MYSEILNEFCNYWGSFLNIHKCASCERCVNYFGKHRVGYTTQNEHICDGFADYKTIDNGAGYWVVECPKYKKSKDFYKLYLQTDLWKTTRRARIKLDNYRCAQCGSPINLNVHHITYDRLGCEDMEDLVTLCKKCHEHLHHN